MFNLGLTFIYFWNCLSYFLSGTLEGVRKSVIAASEHALNNINILNHDGGHPRKGAVDFIPIQQSNLNNSSKIAFEIGKINCFELLLYQKFLSAQITVSNINNYTL